MISLDARVRSRWRSTPTSWRARLTGCGQRSTRRSPRSPW